MVRFEAVVLHDFFVDRVVLSKELGALLRSIERKGALGGGGLHDVPQVELRGGNATNLAHALGRLGTATYLITHSDEPHLSLLRKSYDDLPVWLSVKPLEPGLTVAFEGRRGSSRVNVMLGHLGGAGEFAPSLLDAGDWKAMERSKVVCVVNWAANRHGTGLLREVRSRVGGKTVFLDPADVRDRIDRYAELLKATRREGLIDWLSANEFEARATAKILGLDAGRLDRVCREVATELGVRFDLHTERESYTSEGKEVYRHRVRRVVPEVLTGAGDDWDAASVHYFLAGEEDGKRIELADTAAGLYLTSKEHRGPTEAEVASFLEHS